MPNDPKTRPLSIYLLKRDITRPDDAVRRDSAIHHITIGHGRGSLGVLYYRPAPSHPPRWTDFFESYINRRELICSNVSAVFVTRAAGRTFAITFGAGRHLLRPDTFQEDFGLRTTLNSVSPDRIRTLDRKTLDATGRHAKEQASRNISIIEFGLDIDKDILRAVTGPPEDPTLGRRLAGADALSVVVPTDLNSLTVLLEKYLHQYGLRRYREHFPWVDNIREVASSELRDELNTALISRIKAGNFERIWIAVPDLVDWQDVAGFTFSKSRTAVQHDDISFETYLAHIGSSELVEESLLHRNRVFCISAETEQPRFEWSIYKCIYAEIDRNRKTYLLNNGRWYQVANDYVQEVDEAIQGIRQSTSLSLPDYNDTSEADYNRRVCDGDRIRYALMDRNLIRYGGGHSQIEFCDIYTRDKKIVHVKRYGGSGTLSHLFAQGSVSANLFLNDQRFRNAVNRALPRSHKLQSASDPVRARDYEVAYVVASKSSSPLVLPFFSRVTLRTAATQLRNMGFRVTLTKVQCT